LTNRIRETVYVLGAGFSKGCGYPLTRDLLPQVWERLKAKDQKSLLKIIQFHHPNFILNDAKSFPLIEQLLTEMKVNADLYDGSRRYAGNFKEEQLQETRSALLTTIAQWFHELYQSARKTPWLKDFVNIVNEQNAAVITFNWDLLLDHELLGEEIQSQHYGLLDELPKVGPLILKPHGSLNWYSTEELNRARPEKRRVLFEWKTPSDAIELFIPPRAIKSRTSRNYSPLLVPPTYIKDFDKPIFRHLWKQTTEVLSTARKIVFIGYSLPADDLQAKFILRCGFHNQREGLIGPRGRTPATGDATVQVINPDKDVASRIQTIANRGVVVSTVASYAEEWVAKFKAESNFL